MKKRVLAFLLATVFVLTLVMSVSAEGVQCDCLLYTSDAADEL